MQCKLLLIIYFLILHNGFAIRWLSLQHSNLHWNITAVNNNPGRGIRSGIRSPCGVARRRYGLAKLQAKLCRNSMEAMPHVQRAAILAAETCQTIFQNRRWNCSSIITAPFLSPDLTRATREQAYVYAISSAALTYTMARACASGALYHCTCASKPSDPPNSNGNFQWGGCGDNINWGTYFAKRFIDNVEKDSANKIKRKRRISTGHELEHERKIQFFREEMASVNLHNNKVGRKVIKESLQTQCKCHGVSGSCSIRTCWKGLPSMGQIGQRLLMRYTNAKEIPEDYLAKNDKYLKTDQLLYLTKSPDYCTRDEKLGSFGTVGRKCNVTSSGPESCRQLCCGRGYRTVVEEKIERCRCRYYNCCYVKCQICRTMSQSYECS